MCMCEHAGMWSSKTCKNFLSIVKFKKSILRIWDLAHSAWYCAVHTSVVFFSVWVDVLVIAFGCVRATSVCDKKLGRKFKLKTFTASFGQKLGRKEMEVRGEFDQPVFVPKAALIRRQGLVNPRGPLVQEPFGSSFFKYNIFGVKNWHNGMMLRNTDAWKNYIDDCSLEYLHIAQHIEPNHRRSQGSNLSH